MEYIKKWIPEPRTAVLAGSSVHVDKTFLAVEMPEIVDHLHYRIVGQLGFYQAAHSL